MWSDAFKLKIVQIQEKFLVIFNIYFKKREMSNNSLIDDSDVLSLINSLNEQVNKFTHSKWFIVLSEFCF